MQLVYNYKLLAKLYLSVLRAIEINIKKDIK
jgi:hypothetical protein